MHQVVDQFGGSDITALEAIKVHAADLMGAFREGLGGEEDSIGGGRGRGVGSHDHSVCLYIVLSVYRFICLSVCLYNKTLISSRGKKKKEKTRLHNPIAGISQRGIACKPEAAVIQHALSPIGTSSDA